MNDMPRILFVEDHLSDFELVQRELRTSLKSCELLRVDTPQDFLDALKSSEPDLILADDCLPDFDGLQALELAKQHLPLIPLIIWTDALREDTALDCMKAGATDYVIKENIKRLAPAVVRALKERQFLLERQQAEATIRDLSRFPEENPNPVLRSTAAGRILYANLAAQPLLLEWKTVVGAAMPDLWKARISACYEEGKTQAFDISIEEHFLSLLLVPLRETGYVNLYGSDITQIRRSEREYRALAEDTTELICRFKPDGTLTYVNNVYCEYYGKTREELLGTSFIPQGVGDFPEKHLAYFRSFSLENPIHSFEQHDFLPDGRKRWREWVDRGIFDENGDLLEVHSTGRDITERKEAQAKFQAIFENSPVGIFQSTTQGRFLSVNPAMARIYGYDSPQDMIDSVTDIAGQLYVNVEERAVFLKKMESEDLATEYEWANRRKDGSIFWTSTSARTVRDAAGKILYYEGFLQDITERKQIDEKLRASESRYRLATRATNDVIWEWDFENNRLLWSENAQLVFGYAADEIGPDASWWDERIHPDDQERVVSRLNLMTAGTGDETVWSDEYRFQLKNGSYAYISDHAYLEHDATGKVIRMIGAMSDITERRRAEQALRESEEKYRLLFDSNPLPMWIFDLETLKFLRVNDAAVRHYGYSMEEFLSMTIEDIRPKEDLERLHQNLVSVTEGIDEAGIWRHRKKDGTLILVDIISHTVEFDGRSGELVLATDVTERKLAEDQLRQSQQELTEAQRVAKIGSWNFDSSTGTLSWSDELYRIFGMDRESFRLTYAAFLELIHPEDRLVVSRKNAEALDQGISFELEYRVLQPKGKIKTIAEIGYATRDEEGQILGLFGTAQDITQRRQAEIERQTLVEIMQGLANTKDLQEFLKLIHQSIGKVVFAKNFFVVFHHKESGLFEEIYSVDEYDLPSPPAKLEKSITSYVFRTAEPLLLTKAGFEQLLGADEIELVGTNSASWLGVPLMTADGIIGVMVVQDYENPDRYSEHDRDFLASIATQVALAIERKRSEDAEREQRILAETLRDTAQILSSTLDYGEVLDHILASVGGVVPHDAATVMLLDDRVARVVRSFGYDERGLKGRVMSIELPLAETANLQQMALTGKPVIVRDTQTFAAWKNTEPTEWVRSNVGAPISIYGECIGFILLDSAQRNFFTDVHAERLEAFANQAAIAIHNAHLLQRAQQEIVERRQAEDALRKAEIKYRSLVERLPVVVYTSELGMHGVWSYVSPQIEQILGFTPEEWMSDPELWYRQLHPDDRDAQVALEDRAYQRGESFDNEYRIHTRDGKLLWIRDSAQVVPPQDHGAPIVQGILMDVTERTQAEEALRQSEERFRQLADHIEEVFWMTDARTGQQIYLSPAASKVWGIPVETLMRDRNTFLHSILPEDRPIVTNALELEKHGERMELEYRIRRPDGSVRWVWERAFPIFDERGRVSMLAGITADITERKQAEINVQHSQARYYQLFESSPVSLWEEDYSVVKKRIEEIQGQIDTSIEDYLSAHPALILELASLVQITDVNEASLRLYGVRQKGDLLKNVLEVSTPDTIPHFKSEILGLMNTGTFQWEGRDWTIPGEELMIAVHGSVPPGYETDWSKVIISITDITERKRAEEEIRRRAQETSALLETSMALTSLDLKSILQSIGSSAKSLFAADGCRIFLMQPDGESLRCVLALQENSGLLIGLKIALGQGVTGIVALTGQAEIVNEMHKDPRAAQVPGTPEREEEAIMFAPLKERDRTIGVLSIRRTGSTRQFQPADLELLEAFASMAASAVSNARLFEETQRRLSELEALYENGLAVGQLLKPAEIGARIIETFARHLSWHHVVIRLLRPGSEELEVIALNQPGLSEEKKADVERHFNQMVGRLGRGLSGWVVQTGVPIRTGNVHAHAQYVDSQEGIESGLYMPLRVGDRVIGVISVESEIPDAFTEQDERLLATLGNQAAVAFENARLYQAAHQEILERTRAQAALWASETHYRELADSITDILFELDHEMRLTHWNKASEMLTGIPQEDAIGKSMYQIFGDSPEQLKAGRVYEDVLINRQAKMFELEMLLKGQKHAFEINAYPSSRGVSVVARDVTQRKLDETLMQKRFELMEYSGHHSLEEVVRKAIDEVSNLTDSHTGFLQSVEPHEMTVQMQTWSTESMRDLGSLEGNGNRGTAGPSETWAEAIRQRQTVIYNKDGSLPNGNAEIRREMIIPILRNDKVVAVLGVGNKGREYSHQDAEIAERFTDYAWDIAERKQMENELAEERNQLARRVEERTADLSRANSNLARALRVKDEFLANMSHELRTPLNAILGLSESLGEQVAGPLNEKQQKYLTTINESGHHLLSLINDILDLAKIEAGQITLDINKVDVDSVCQASLRMVRQLAQKKNQEVEFKIDPHIGLMWADERRLKQMLVNLLSNAVKFTPEGGSLGLEVQGDRAGNRVILTVWDHGIGIQERDMDRLFRPFVQLDAGLAREASGTGLGLALVAQMARMHGGSVSVVSQFGEGSRFIIQLPWEPALATDTSMRLRTTGRFRAIDPQATKPTILLVEDTREVVMMLVDYLELAGYKLVTAQDGIDGIEQAKLSHPDLILMDIQMPRMDGFEATQRLRLDSEFKHTPIIALTALAMPNDRQRCLDAGMDEYISKPVNLKALVKLIESILLNKEDNKAS